MTKPAVVLGTRFQEALAYAVEVHRHQGRKGSNVPFLGHVLGTCRNAIMYGADEDEAIAALLHDAAEDQGGLKRLEDIRKRFGDRVADIVAACSDTFEEPKPAWEPRKEAYLARLRHEPDPVLLVAASDKLDNVQATLADYLDEGDALWGRFTRGKEKKLWFYKEAVEAMRQAQRQRGFPDGLRRLVDDLERTTRELVRAVEAGEGPRGR